ncbi:uncharacterized protein LOC6565475 [Drosophila grimshawi]|uniref:uncharacterized protein LOC6565475 n=1 Tax=Drosophila grimshawi TaxID=7222 RepID=UPI001C9357CF|nr:uncharacterized protein LOC6565475 [Drosophila grimshawi]
MQVSVCGAQSQPRMSRRPAGKTTVEDSSEKSVVPDQLALAAIRSNGHGRSFARRGVQQHSRTKEPTPDYSYGQLELNLIRPEHETSSLPPHGKISPYYSTTAESVRTAGIALGDEKTAILEDSETAAEYVANAMKMAYGTRQREPSSPLHIVANTLRPSSSSEQQQQQQQQQTQNQSNHAKTQAQAALLEAQMQAELQAQLTDLNGGDIERLYRTKYYSYPPPQQQQLLPQLYRNIEEEAEEKVRVSASTEIPKAEIMKQIEKSVIKYMKELEAEGKIITTPQELAPPATKTYYKLLSLPNPSSSGSGPSSSASIASEEKRYSSSTVRPKYSNPPATGSQTRQPGQQHGQYHAQHSHLHPHQQSHSHSHSHQPQHHQLSKQGTKPQRYQSETETAYQAPDISSESLAPNVEFIYKIKTRAPLQTATVKTISKPYTLPLKSSAEHFDHGAALKNIEEFDLSHVVTTPEHEQDERERDRERVTSKPQKLYFNSEIYHDINSLPYKAEKQRGSNIHAIQGQEYRHKLKSAVDLHPEYKGYSGYFAEPVSSSMELAEKQPLPSGLGTDNGDDGYPLPYQYVLKKEPLNSKYEEERDSWEQSMRQAHGKLPANAGGGYKSGVAGGNAASSSSSLDYDSYSPKFNNNPEGYGYQHTYRTQLLRGATGNSGNLSGGGKRGKRGGAPHPAAAGSQGKKLLRGGVKDLEANLALRPPPKN